MVSADPVESGAPRPWGCQRPSASLLSPDGGRLSPRSRAATRTREGPTRGVYRTGPAFFKGGWASCL